MIEVVCAVVVRGGRVLLCQRARGTHLAGCWEFPGGKVEEGEDPRRALAREIREELAWEIEVGEALAAVEHRYPEIVICLQPFRCEGSATEPVALEHEQIGWFAPEEIAALELAEADRKIWDLINPESELLN